MKSAEKIEKMSKTIQLIFPNQLFEKHPLLKEKGDYYLIEEFLFFSQYAFHKQKIAFHRASMKHYEHFLKQKEHKVKYIDAADKLADIRNLEAEIKAKNITEIKVLNPEDDFLEQRLINVCKNIKLTILDSPLFINNKKDLSSFFKTDKQFYFQTAFYKQERVRLGILVDNSGEPEGGKWTYDQENRKKFPKNAEAPEIKRPRSDEYWKEAISYTEKNFTKNPGFLGETPLYPTNHNAAETWLTNFFETRFKDFGIYEDAIVKNEEILHHSVLSPLINAGLLTPIEVVEKALAYAKQHKIPLNSLEGFIRQIIGWREFMRAIYLFKGRKERTRNYFKFSRKMPKSFYDGSTGIPPIDDTIKKVLKSGYCHHIERLMILGNFMLLCEIDPDEVYRWFMELFVDAYDWVMVPNIYGMSQFADGGIFATKPYISGSNYLKKMSDYEKGDWEEIWDGLFWNFVCTHRDFFKNNPRVSMMYFSYSKMSEEKKRVHKFNAESFLKHLK